jgi:hypothetical protein
VFVTAVVPSILVHIYPVGGQSQSPAALDFRIAELLEIVQPVVKSAAKDDPADK